MSDVKPPLTKEDFEHISWQNVVETVSPSACSHYYARFYQEAEKCQSAGDSTGERVFLQLALWTRPALKDDADPFPESLLQNLVEADFLLLRDLASTSVDAELRARLADLAWHGRFSNKRDPEMARLAIKSYLDASKTFPDHWWEEFIRVERALVLSLSLGRKASEIEDTWNYIESRLAATNGEDEWFLSERLMALLQEYGRGDSAVYAPMAERAALKAQAMRGVGQWEKARCYWQVKAGWHEKETVAWFEALRKAAETHVAEAQDEIDGFFGRQEPIAAAHHLQRAIEAYRNIIPHNQFQARIDELHRQMIEVNKQAVVTFKSYTSTPIDLTDYARKAADQVKDKTFTEALETLVLLYTSPTLDSLRRQVAAGTSEISELLAAHHKVNGAGQVIARRPSLLSTNPQEREEAVEAQMFAEAPKNRGLFVQALLFPALHQMRSQHQVFTWDWVHLIRNSPFVPDDRLLLFARGFQAGWDNQWDVSTHLLVPQVENSIRYILMRNGTLASALHPSGVQSEQGLDQTLKKPELSALLPGEVIFDLRGLLTEQMGDYLRHRTSHGLSSFAEFFSAPSIYLWWITLKLCLLPLLSLASDAESDSD